MSLKFKGMKLRRLIEDFVVEELNNFTPSDSGKFKLFSLEKRGLETYYIINYLSRTNNIPRREFGYAGLKDKHAITKQYLTIPCEREINTLKEKNFDIGFIGYVDKKIQLGELLGNRFKITVREITKGELKEIYKRASKITEIGVPNYYDSQRFGSFIKGVFIAKLVAENQFEQAVKAYLTSYKKSENKDLKKDKREILSKWPELSNANVKNKTLKAIIDEFLKHNDWEKAYTRIPSHVRELHKHSYESYQWNENVKNLIKNLEATYSIKYNAGTLLFYKKISENEIIKIPPVIDGRNVIVKPTNFTISEPLNDELSKHRFKINVSFDLLKGSYATIIIKRIFNK